MGIFSFNHETIHDGENSDNLKRYDKQHVTVQIGEDLNSVCIKTV